MRYVPGKTGKGGHALKSQLVTTCLLCGDISRAPGARAMAPQRRHVVTSWLLSAWPPFPVFPGT